MQRTAGAPQVHRRCSNEENLTTFSRRSAFINRNKKQSQRFLYTRGAAKQKFLLQ